MTDIQSNKHGFIKRLESYRDREERAVMAALRRGHKPEMFRYVIDYQTERNKDFIYMTASLFALHPSPNGRGNMGEHLRRLATNEGRAESTERRFVNLLRMRRETIERPLRQCISILRSADSGIPINWNRLFWDLHDWDEPDHRIQERWARSFWRAAKSKST